MRLKHFSIRDLLWLTLVVAIVFGFLMYLYVRKPPLQEWEYQWVNAIGTADPLTKEGGNGWEACGVIENAGRTKVLMKRPKQ